MPAPGFGSFNSGNVEDMISDPEWTPPQPPSFLEDFDGAVGATCGFGAAMRACFLLEPGWTFVNHGAFGAPLAAAFEVSSRWRRYAEQQPLRFIDRELFPYLVKVTKQMAVHLCVDARDLVLVPNATTAREEKGEFARKSVIEVPDKDVGLVIGKKGATVRMIENITGAKVQVYGVCMSYDWTGRTSRLRAWSLTICQKATNQQRLNAIMLLKMQVAKRCTGGSSLRRVTLVGEATFPSSMIQA